MSNENFKLEVVAEADLSKKLMKEIANKYFDSSSDGFFVSSVKFC